MARPRKVEGAPGAREMLLQAFWGLLASNQLDEISVGMVARAAGYNRGTFYYYFADKDALVEAAVESELHDVPRTVLRLITEADAMERSDLFGNRLVRLSLFMSHGGRDIVERNVKDYILATWTTLLVPDGGQVKPGTRLILEYMSSGMVGLLAYLGTLREEDAAGLSPHLIEDFSSFAFRAVCEEQGVERDEILARLRMLEQFSKVSAG